MELSPEVKAQLEAQKEQCPFCKIVSGEIAGKKVYSDDEIECVLDINPALPGHTLILPKEHYPILPYLPPETFKHLFGLLPQLVKAEKTALLKTSANIFIANGASAGQQSPHFLVHLLPREAGDGFTHFDFSQAKQIDMSKQEEAEQLLAKNIPLMLQNHFGRQPASWHTGKGSRPDHLSDAENVVYEDEKVLVVVSSTPQAVGHLEIYSKEEEHDLEKLSAESSSHLFYVASYAATALFEGLGAQGTNIVLQSGSDTDSDKLTLHILPRTQDDELDLLWKPMGDKGDLDGVASRIKDQTDMISLEKETGLEKDSHDDSDNNEEEKEPTPPKKTGNKALDEINDAISKLHD